VSPTVPPLEDDGSDASSVFVEESGDGTCQGYRILVDVMRPQSAVAETVTIFAVGTSTLTPTICVYIYNRLGPEHWDSKDIYMYHFVFWFMCTCFVYLPFVRSQRVIGPATQKSQ
jgi:hypothetical protein